MHTTSGRLLRAVAVAVITLGLSSLAHVAAGGPLPPASGLAGLLVLSVAAAYPLCRGSIARRALVPMLALAQAVLHPMFSFAANPPWIEPVDPVAASGHHSSSLTMLLAHLAAALVAASLVLFVDHLVVELIAEYRWWPEVPPRAVPVGPVPFPVSATPVRPARLLDLIDQAPRRGPPVTV